MIIQPHEQLALSLFGYILSLLLKNENIDDLKQFKNSKIITQSLLNEILNHERAVKWDPVKSSNNKCKNILSKMIESYKNSNILDHLFGEIDTNEYDNNKIKCLNNHIMEEKEYKSIENEIIKCFSCNDNESIFEYYCNKCKLYLCKC